LSHFTQVFFIGDSLMDAALAFLLGVAVGGLIILFLALVFLK
jgi:hypothetical protein